MKKLFTLFAALCCMVFMVKAEDYPIKLGGKQMSDVESTFVNPIVDAGTMSYDAASHTLTLDNVQTSGVVLEIMESADPITIRLVGKSNIQNLTMGKNALEINCPVIITSEGIFLNEVSFDGYAAGILINSKGSLTLTAAVVKAMGADYGIQGKNDGDKYPTLKIDGSSLTAYGVNQASIGGVADELKDVHFDDTEMGFEDHAVKKGGSVVQNTDVKISSDVDYVYAAVSSGKGKVSIIQDGTNKGTFVVFEGPSMNLKFKAEPAEGWVFGGWYHAGALQTTNTEAEMTAYGGGGLYALFIKKAPSNEPWHMIGANKLWDMPVDMVSVPTNVATLPGTVKNVYNAVVVKKDGDKQLIAYTDETSSSTVGLFTTAYDTKNKTMDAASAKVNPIKWSTNSYYPVSAMTQRLSDGHVFMATYNTTSNKYQILSSDLTAINKNWCSLGSPVTKDYPLVAMIFDSEINMYGIAKGTDGNAWLYQIDYASSGLLTPIMSTGVMYSPDYKSQALSMDVKTGKLIYMVKNGTTTYFFELDKEAEEANMIGYAAGSSFSALFQWVPALYKIEVAVKEGYEDLGSVKLGSGYNPWGNYYEGAEVTIQAIPSSEDYRFVKWSDGDTKNPRTVKVTKDAKYTAEFGYKEGITPYSVWVYGKQVHSGRLSFTNAEIAKITAGSITYNPSTNTLELNGLTMSNNDATALIRIGEEGKSTKMTIKVVNADSKLTGTLSAVPLRLYNADVTVKGDKKLTLDGAGCGVFLGKGSKLMLEGVTATIKGSYAINGDETSANEKLMVKGSTVSLNGSSKAAYELNGGEWNYCTPYPANAYFDKEKKNFTQGEGGSELVNVTFTADKHVKGVAVQDGTGTFQIRLRDGGGETFTDIGWFESGKELTMIAKPAAGFVFGRWTDDTKWGDTDKRDEWLKATREDITMGALDITKQALFYKQPAAGATWYCVSNTTNNFTQFASRSYGDKKVDTDKTDASSIEAGDCNGSYYYIAEGGEIKRFSFSGVSKDKEVAGYSKAVKRAAYSGSITDMAYNYADSKVYVVMDGDKKLYRVNEATDKQCLDEIGEFVTGDPETKVTITCIAIDGGGKKYVLSSSNILYTVEKEDTKEKKVKLKVVGEEGGKVGGPTVGGSSQSLAFDHVNGELFWGAKDYLRIIDLKTAKSYIAGDLGLTGGNQGYLKALHRKDRKLSLGVQVAAECAEMGTASIATEGQTELTTFAGTSVTITAKENEGYKFVRWQELLDEYADRDPEIVTENPYDFSASSSITYVAYFESAEQGIEGIQSTEYSVQKVLEEGNLYIIRDGKVYNVTGNRVK